MKTEFVSVFEDDKDDTRTHLSGLPPGCSLLSVLRAFRMTTGNFEKNLWAIWSALAMVSAVFEDEDMRCADWGWGQSQSGRHYRVFVDCASETAPGVDLQLDNWVSQSVGSPIRWDSLPLPGSAQA